MAVLDKVIGPTLYQRKSSGADVDIDREPTLLESCIVQQEHNAGIIQSITNNLDQLLRRISCPEINSGLLGESEPEQKNLGLLGDHDKALHIETGDLNNIHVMVQRLEQLL